MSNTEHGSNKSKLLALINKDKIKSKDACNHSVQNLLSSTLIYRNIKIEVYRNIISHFVFYEHKTYSLKLVEEQKSKLFQNRVLWKTFGSQEVVIETRENRTMRKFFVFLTKYHYGVEIKENETERAQGMCGRERKCIHGVSLSGTFCCDI